MYMVLSTCPLPSTPLRFRPSRACVLCPVRAASVDGLREFAKPATRDRPHACALYNKYFYLYYLYMRVDFCGRAADAAGAVTARRAPHAAVSAVTFCDTDEHAKSRHATVAS